MKDKNKLSVFQFLVLIINIIGIAILTILTVRYFSFDYTIPNPDAMLPGAVSDGAGFLVLLGTFPMIIANIVAFVSFKNFKVPARLLLFVPAVICIFVGIHYLFLGPWKIDFEEEKYIYDVKIDLNISDEIYGLSTSYELNGEIIESGGVREADYSVFKNEPIYIRITEEEFPEGITDYSNLIIHIKFYTNEEDLRQFKVDPNVDEILLTPSMGEQVIYSMIGNKDTGYEIKIK